MRVLAIDTALEACSAAVLDLDRGGIVASETIPMVRGHAEALMPLIARVMDWREAEFAGLDRISVTTGPGSFTGLRVGISAARGIGAGVRQAGDRALHALRLRGAAHRRGRHQQRRGRDRCAARSRLSADFRHRRPHHRCAADRPAARSGARRDDRARPARRLRRPISLPRVWPKNAEPPLLIEQRSAPDIAWIARLGAAAADGYASPKPLYLRAPDAQPQDAARLPRR